MIDDKILKNIKELSEIFGKEQLEILSLFLLQEYIKPKDFIEFLLNKKIKTKFIKQEALNFLFISDKKNFKKIYNNNELTTDKDRLNMCSFIDSLSLLRLKVDNPLKYKNIYLSGLNSPTFLSRFLYLNANNGKEIVEDFIFEVLDFYINSANISELISTKTHSIFIYESLNDKEYVVACEILLDVIKYKIDSMEKKGYTKEITDDYKKFINILDLNINYFNKDNDNRNKINIFAQIKDYLLNNINKKSLFEIMV